MVDALDLYGDEGRFRQRYASGSRLKASIRRSPNEETLLELFLGTTAFAWSIPREVKPLSTGRKRK